MAKRKQEDLMNLSQNREQSIYLTNCEAKGEEPQREIADYLEKIEFGAHMAPSILKNVLHLLPFFKKVRYKTYDDTDNGIYKMESDAGNSELSIALTGDWASYTDESEKVAELIKSFDPNYTIHLGDTYYTGSEKEIKENFHPETGKWHYGKNGSFALIGNHEMYSGGKHYFNDLLKWMGIRKNGAQISPQKASFFCLENEFWRIVAIDTGFTADKGIAGTGDNQDLDITPEQLKWLKETVRFGDDNRGIILLSHHQPWCAFKGKKNEDETKDKATEYPNPAITLSGKDLIGVDRPVLWWWGHDHHLAFYGCPDQGLKAFGRGIGHGGTPVQTRTYDSATNSFPQLHDPKKKKLVLFDNREKRKINDKVAISYNGFAMLKLQESNLSIEYYDENKNLIVSEKWAMENNVLKGISITDETANQDLVHLSSNIRMAIENLKEEQLGSQ